MWKMNEEAKIRYFYTIRAGAFSEPSLPPKMGHNATIFAKSSILDVCLSSEYTSVGGTS